MNQLFFGRSTHQLFGAYHEPPRGAAARGAAVLCAPWGPEYFVSHRILHQLAERLSAVGYHVLHFDYYGTGDSGGNREEGDLFTWYDDASMAVDELREMSERSTVLAMGIRLGAVVAWRLTQRRSDVGALMMWDPIVDGPHYLSELAVMQAEVDRRSLSPRRGNPHQPSLVLGMPLSAAMRASIQAVTPAEFGQLNSARVSIFFSDHRHHSMQLRKSMHADGTPAHIETMPGETAWHHHDGTAVGRVPHRVLERMVEVVR